MLQLKTFWKFRKCAFSSVRVSVLHERINHKNIKKFLKVFLRFKNSCIKLHFAFFKIKRYAHDMIKKFVFDSFKCIKIYTQFHFFLEKEKMHFPLKYFLYRSQKAKNAILPFCYSKNIFGYFLQVHCYKYFKKFEKSIYSSLLKTCHGFINNYQTLSLPTGNNGRNWHFYCHETFH